MAVNGIGWKDQLMFLIAVNRISFCLFSIVLNAIFNLCMFNSLFSSRGYIFIRDHYI